MADHLEATGHLQVGGFQYTVVIQFGLGKPIHAYSPFNQGTEAILELFTWSDGKISFVEGMQPEVPTVEDNAPQILTLGEEYVRNMEFLQKLEITELSFLLRSALKLNEQELEKVLVAGAPISIKMQKEFYGNIYGTLNIKDIAQKMVLSESQWMATVSNLLRLGLILTPDGRTLEATGLQAPAPARPKTTSDLKSMIASDLDRHVIEPHMLTHAAPSGSWGEGGSGSGKDTSNHFKPAQSGAPGTPLMPPMGVFQTRASEVPPAQLAVTGQLPQQPFPQQPPQPPQSAPPQTPQFPAPQTPQFPAPQPAAFGSLPPQSQPLESPIPFPQPQVAQQQPFGAPPAPAPAPVAPAPAPSTPPLSTAPTTPQAIPQETTAPTLPIVQQPAAKSFHLGVPQVMVTLEEGATSGILAGLSRTETGILSSDAILFFLEREFARAFRFSTTFTFMPFCITVSATGWPVLPAESVAAITRALDNTCREVDVFGHFGERGFAFILPNVDSNQACGLVDRIATSLPQQIPQLAEYAPILHFGIASVPTDAKDLQTLISSAQQAMFEAAKRNVTRVRFVELAQQQAQQ